MRSSLLALRARPRRVVLASVVVDAINSALDAVLAYAALIVSAQQQAPASINHEAASRIELLRLPGMHESPPTS